MKKPLRVGVTGGIGSGKSLICKIFASLGIPTYDADSRARLLMTENQSLVSQIKKEFGENSYLKDGSLNREFLGKEVFNNEAKLKVLNSFVHPAVATDSEQWIEQNSQFPYIIKEAALLYESGSYKTLDKIIVITAPEDLRVQRVMSRDKSRTREDVMKIIRNQMKEEEKINRADFIITNDESELVIPQVLKLHKRFNNDIEK
ncbi:dephospho-CoA kinase [Cytophagales bacterium WSM2-2]|nr:dephospho-CoA kinase [Cytophagales bacterium WSM2-2]